ncbi:MFS transporter [Sulfitobacter geojensis]|uniref:MFS transporter n=1 Tax=Sulfitobacter geojensis TaxID=1342299 RepID=A0AAE2VXU6_9RHOB|nr:MFS transporter [Sulfitobacter geojensis]MBM1689038.1 MFS transporter [Sulfitobacter geojensis]MBM1693105.1 MFS transporter [Sulfitobacter geojensis]MBM1705271.1 MFS transporter [Sulfitobacter geojensis]MBM1709329.1 MFS transporter [Sulfitobacter geojensis]MBM1713394.1 MFS transporter [Sulfitobacter geojensis]
MTQYISLEEAKALPFWRRPVSLLFLMALAMPIAFNTWSALLNNFVIEVADFDGADIGLLHTVREIPGFLAVGVIAIIIFVREQVLGLVSLVLLGAATAVTAWFPSMGGILTITMLSSIGFHYYETVNQSLQLQWLKIEDAPRMLGWLLAAGSFATLIAYLAIMALWETLSLSYNIVYLAGGGVTVVIALFAMVAYPQFEAPTPQNKTMVLRRRYWLYYALQFMGGARRQIFVVFAGFMMVERFGYEVHEITTLYLINLVANIFIAPLMGRAVGYFGERRTLGFEYIGLVLVFLSYGGVYYLGWGVVVAAMLYVLDHMFFGLAMAQKTYFQKIADPADIAPTAAVAFTINHIAAVFLPVGLGLLWLVSPAAVFFLAAGMAAVSFALAMLIPRHPTRGNETIFSAGLPQAAQ